jgi:hypothetical protein
MGAGATWREKPSSELQSTLDFELDISALSHDFGSSERLISDYIAISLISDYTG